MSKGFLLQGLGTKKVEFMTALQETLAIDAFVFLKVDTQIASKRKLRQTLTLEAERLVKMKKSEKEIATESQLTSDEKIMDELMNK